MCIEILKNMESRINNDLKLSPYYDHDISLNKDIVTNEFVVKANLADIVSGDTRWVEAPINSGIMTSLEIFLLKKYGIWIDPKKPNFQDKIKTLLANDFLVACEYAKNWELKLKDIPELKDNFLKKYEESKEIESSVFNKYMPFPLININKKLRINIDVELLLLGFIRITDINENQISFLNQLLLGTLNDGTIEIKVVYRFKEICSQNSLVCCCSNS